MNLSHKLTFSLICFVVLLSFAAIPAMAQVTISAEWTDDLNDDNTADDPGWDVTVGGLADITAITVSGVNVGGAAIDAGDITTVQPDDAADVDATATIPAAIGTVIAVQVAVTTPATEAAVYQRVTFPASDPNAADVAATNLVLIPKLTKLATPDYYVNFADNTATVTFNFEAAEADSHGAPGADLHISDVTPVSGEWQIVSVTGNNRVTIRSTSAAAATSNVTPVSLVATYALAADAATPANTPPNGQARVFFDDTAPTAAVPAADDTSTPPIPYPLRAVSLSTDFAAPEVDEDTVWDEDFYLRVLINDDDAGGGVMFTASMVSFDKENKLEVVQVGMDANQAGAADGDANDGVYLIHLRLVPDRVTTAGEEVVIIITPVDRSGNPATAPARQTVKLAQMDAPTPTPNRAPDFGQNTIQDITAQATVTAVNVTLPAAVDPDGDNLTYTLTGLPAGLSFNAGTRVLSGTPSAMSAAATYTYTVTDDGSPAMSASLTFMITVSAAPVPVDLREMDTATSSKVFTLQPGEFVIVVRDMDAMNNEGIQFRSDVRVVEWATMPNLERLFYRGNEGIILGNGGGGALILKESATQTKDRRQGSVGISEIMWGIDEGHLGDEDQEKSSQWIELHNLNAMVADNAATEDVNEADDGVAKVYLSWKTGRDITNDPTITGNLSNPVLDVVTNFFNNRPGHTAWNVEDKGSSGNSIAGTDFVSMARILPHKKSAYANADGARYDNRDGRAAGHWNPSGVTYLIARTTKTDTTDVVYEYKGTPGRVNNVSVQNQPHIIAGRTGVATNDIMINEVGNNSNDLYDWIEIKGPAGKNLRNYLISIVRDNSADNVLVQFDANDNAKIAANGHFLILRSDPANDPDHPIAATGYNVDLSAEEQQPGTPKSDVRYKVFSGGTRGALNLPNDGKFVLIVRRPDNHEGHRSGQDGGKGVAERGNADLDKVVDVAGWDDNLGKNDYPNEVSDTGLWPLHSFGAPFTNRNAFWQNTVHRRQYVSTNDGRSGVGAHENKNQDDRAAFRDIGWTGVGYRRAVTPSNMHGGTPGYPNNALHGAGGTITTAVYISEIMYADASNGTLPQWIELRNPSNVGANLHNWRLTIKNHVDAVMHEDGLWDGKVEASVLLRDLKIKPNGTVLITSRKGPRSEVHLASDDVFSLFPTHRKTFAMTTANSDVINTFGFRITLHANGHEGDRNKWQLVDDVGNLATPDPNDRRGNNERFDMPRWMWPNAVDETGARSSVARTNNKAQGLGDGKMAGSWVLSSMDMRTSLIDYVYYGSTSDISTPGQTVGQPLPVELSFFRPTSENGKVTIQWTTESELDNAGFNILRSDSRNGEFTKVNEQMIQGKGTTAERTTYKWVDTTAKPGAVYYYQIEDVSLAGEHNTLATTRLKGLVSAKGKRTLQWGELKNLR